MCFPMAPFGLDRYKRKCHGPPVWCVRLTPRLLSGGLAGMGFEDVIAIKKALHENDGKVEQAVANMVYERMKAAKCTWH